jgi:glutathionylspermidine amidase/synthetase
MGIKWQCVEYARRWLFLRKGCVFDSIDAAADMWTQLKYVQRVVDGQCFPLKKYPNGNTSRPEIGSLLIYKRSDAGMPFGHVAVIVNVLRGFIQVAEENYYPYYWSGNYSRQIPYVLRKGRYYINDDYTILGWMSVEDKRHRTVPLNQKTINEIIRLNGTAPDFNCPNKINYH